MSVQNDNLIPRTIKVPLSDAEDKAFSAMLQKTWQKKGGFLRLVILRELEKENMLPTPEVKND